MLIIYLQHLLLEHCCLLWSSDNNKMSIRVIMMFVVVLMILVAMAGVTFAQRGGGGGLGIAQHDVVSNCDKWWLNLCPRDHDSTFKVPEMKSFQPLSQLNTYIVATENSNVKSAIIVIIFRIRHGISTDTCTVWSPF